MPRGRPPQHGSPRRGTAAVALPYAGLLRIETRPLRDEWAERKLALCTSNPATLSAASRALVEHLMAHGA